MKTCLAAALSAAHAIATVAPAFAADFTPKYTYSGDGMTFEKVSHANSPTETADGIVDYTGNGSIAPYVQGVSADGNGGDCKCGTQCGSQACFHKLFLHFQPMIPFLKKLSRSLLTIL